MLWGVAGKVVLLKQGHSRISNYCRTGIFRDMKISRISFFLGSIRPETIFLQLCHDQGQIFALVLQRQQLPYSNSWGTVHSYHSCGL